MVEQSKVQLIAQLDRARTGLSRTAAELRHDVDLPQHLRSTYINHKGAWIGGAAALGWVISRLPGRTKKQKVQVAKNSHPNGTSQAQARKYAMGGILLTLLRFVFDALKPTLTTIASRKIKDMAVDRIRW